MSDNKTTPTEERKLKRYRVFKNHVLHLDCSRINQAQKMVEELKAEKTEHIKFIDTKDQETIVYTKTRYQKNYRVTASKK